MNQSTHDFGWMTLLTHTGKIPAKTPGVKKGKKLDATSFPEKIVGSEDLPSSTPSKVGQNTPAAMTASKSRPFGSTLTTSQLNTARKEINPNSKNSLMDASSSSSATVQKLSYNQPSAVKFSSDEAELEVNKGTTKAVNIDENSKDVKKSSLEKEEILDKEECSTREKEDMDFDLLDGADVLEEAFCGRRNPGSTFNPYSDDPFGLIYDRVNLLRSDRKKYSMESDYLQSDFFDDLPPDETPQSKHDTFHTPYL